MSALEQRLLEAARHDHIPDALSARMAEGLGVQAAGAALQASAHASVSAGGKLGAPLFAKSGLWGTLALVGALGIAGVQLWPRAGSQRATAVTAPSVTARSASTAVATPPPAATRADPHAAEQPGGPAAAEAVRPAPLAARSISPSGDSALRAEVTLLDRARLALRDGESARALRLLDQHGRRFAYPTLAPEAAALRIEALTLQGHVHQADALAQRFATSHPSHPLRARVDALRARGSRPTSSARAPAP